MATHNLRKIFDKEVLPLLSKKIRKTEKYFAIFEYMAINEKARIDKGIREAEFPKILQPCRTQLNAMSDAGIIEQTKPSKNQRTWFDSVNDISYSPWEWGDAMRDYADKLAQHANEDENTSHILKKVTRIDDDEKLVEYISSIHSREDYMNLIEKLIEYKVPIQEREYGPLDWRNSPFKYKLAKFFLEITEVIVR